MGELSWQIFLLIGLTATVGAFVQAVVGLGIGLLTAPVVALVAPSLVPALPLWLALLVSGSMLAAERAHIDWPSIAWALPARVPGTVVGAWLVSRFTEVQIGVALAVMVLLAVAVTVHTVAVPVNPATLVTAGFVAGASGTATSIGGPPIALLFQRRPPEVVRATLSVFFFVGVLLSLAGLAVGGTLDRQGAELAAAFAPGVLVGLLVGIALRDLMPREAFRRGVLVVCAASAVALLVRSIVG
ncbi:MAG: sulfite exporter TauE/SafE family protein [Nocardioides sp.]